VPRLLLASVLSLAPVAFAVGCGERTSLTTECAWGSVCTAGPAAPAAPLLDAGLHDASIAIVDASLGAPDATDAAGPTDAAEDVAYPAADLADVFIVSGVYAGSASSSVTAFFYTTPSSLGCTRSVVAGCVKTVCGPQLDPSTEELATAGTLSINGGLYPIVLEEEDAGPYSSTADALLFHGSEPILVSTSGGDVPAFTVAATAPTEIIVSPVATTVPRAQPYAIQWTGTSAGSVAIDLQVTTSSGDEYLECLFDPRAGLAVVPSEALESLPAGMGEVGVLAISVVESSAGAWEIKAILESYASDTGGNAVNVAAEFE
jgi:hypothetical protein